MYYDCMSYLFDASIFFYIRTFITLHIWLFGTGNFRGNRNSCALTAVFNVLYLAIANIVFDIDYKCNFIIPQGIGRKAAPFGPIHSMITTFDDHITICSTMYRTRWYNQHFHSAPSPSLVMYKLIAPVFTQLSIRIHQDSDNTTLLVRFAPRINALRRLVSFTCTAGKNSASMKVMRRP